MLKYIIFILFIFSNISILKAQDATYSQFYNNKLFLNPAYTGSAFGTRFSTSYRWQWSYLPGQLHNGNFAVDQTINRYGLGLGFVFNRDTEGEQTISINQALASVSYTLLLSKPRRKSKTIKPSKSGRMSKIPKPDRSNRQCNDENIILAFGLQGGVVNQNLEMGNALFGDQIDERGYIISQISQAQSVFDTNPFFIPTINAGVALWWDRGTSKNRLGTVYSFGLSVKNFGLPTNNFFGRQASFINQDAPVNARLTANFAASIFVAQRRNIKITLVPIGLWETQSPLSTANVGLLAVGSDKSSQSAANHLYFGLSYRSEKPWDLQRTNALIVHTGFKHIKFSRSQSWGLQIGYSYDYTLSDLRVAAHGSHELNIVINWAKAPGGAPCVKALKCYYERAKSRSELFLLY